MSQNYSAARMDARRSDGRGNTTGSWGVFCATSRVFVLMRMSEAKARARARGLNELDQVNRPPLARPDLYVE